MGMTTEHDPDDSLLTPAELNAAASYHAPPGTVPREMMWDAIQAQRTQQNRVPVHVPALPAVATAPVVVTHTTRGSLSRLVPRGLLAIATAAVIVIVIGVARRAPVVPESPDINAAAGTATAAPPAPAGDAWQVASSEHFGTAETMLTTLAGSREVRGDRQLTAWSRDLLESTRLLMDSPAGRDPKRRVLMQELELVLVQLVESGPTMRTEDRSVMDELLSRSALLLTRIRTTVPAGLPALNH
jgi:hypothetical protein